MTCTRCIFQPCRCECRTKTETARQSASGISAATFDGKPIAVPSNILLQHFHKVWGALLQRNPRIVPSTQQVVFRWLASYLRPSHSFHEQTLYEWCIQSLSTGLQPLRSTGGGARVRRAAWSSRSNCSQPCLTSSATQLSLTLKPRQCVA